MNGNESRAFLISPVRRLKLACLPYDRANIYIRLLGLILGLQHILHLARFNFYRSFFKTKPATFVSSFEAAEKRF
jgi:hypothetical protein